MQGGCPAPFHCAVLCSGRLVPSASYAQRVPRRGFKQKQDFSSSVNIGLYSIQPNPGATLSATGRFNMPVVVDLISFLLRFDML